MKLELPGFVRAHPVETGAVALVGVVGLYILLHSGSASAATSSGSPSAAELQLASQTQAEQFQLAEISAQSGAQSAHDVLAYNLAMAQLGAQSSTALDQLNATVALTKYTTAANLQLQELGIQTQYAIAHDNNQTVIASQNIAATEQEQAAAENAALLAHLSDNQTAASIANTQAAISISGINAQVAMHNSGGGGGFLGTLIGGFLGAFL